MSSENQESETNAAEWVDLSAYKAPTGARDFVHLVTRRRGVLLLANLHTTGRDKSPVGQSLDKTLFRFAPLRLSYNFLYSPQPNAGLNTGIPQTERARQLAAR